MSVEDPTTPAEWQAHIGQGDQQRQLTARERYPIMARVAIRDVPRNDTMRECEQALNEIDQLHIEIADLEYQVREITLLYVAASAIPDWAPPQL